MNATRIVKKLFKINFSRLGKRPLQIHRQTLSSFGIRYHSTPANQHANLLAKPDGNSTLTWLVKSMEDCVINILPTYTKDELSNVQVLDIGCGVGNYCQRMANSIGFNNVYGIDISPSQIDICNKVNHQHIHAQNKRKNTNGNENDKSTLENQNEKM